MDIPEILSWYKRWIFSFPYISFALPPIAYSSIHHQYPEGTDVNWGSSFKLTPCSRVFLEELKVTQVIKKFPHVMQLEGLLWLSKKPPTGPCPESDKASLHLLTILLWRFNNILLSTPKPLVFSLQIFLQNLRLFVHCYLYTDIKTVFILRNRTSYLTFWSQRSSW
jgi:hypothetical protein